MMYSFNYKRGTQVFDNVKSLADAINFELPRNWDCSGEMNRKADEINAFVQKKVSCAHLGVVRIMQRDEDEWLYCAGRRYFIDSDSPWFPVCEENLLPE